MRTQKSIRNTIALSLLAALAGTASLAQAEQVWARVISATPSHETTGNTRYNVTYEYGGRHYTTVTDTRPGASIPIEVATTASQPPRRWRRNRRSRSAPSTTTAANPTGTA